MRVFWFADQLLNAPGKQWSFTSGTPQPTYVFENGALTIGTPPDPLSAGIDGAAF